MTTGTQDRRVLVGMSGGVDSSVAAALLVEQGYEVEGLFMFNWSEDEQGYCTAAEDFQDASRVCESLNIPLHRADFSEEYHQRVFKYFLSEYAAGRTPNPDLLCNREIKFKSFLKFAQRLGAHHIATGHYARLLRDDRGLHLLQARDSAKDQTYFLSAVPQEAFETVLFPVGDLLKPAVRNLAARYGLPNHDKKDSTGICFIGERRFRDFLAGYLPAQPGPIADMEGREIGHHQGLMYYTIGQRKGIGVGGVAGRREAPWYVADKDLATNTLRLTQDRQHPLLYCAQLVSGEIQWIGAPRALPLVARARIRHRQPLQPCCVEAYGSSEHRVRFADPQWAIAPGQFVAFYDGDECVGSAPSLRRMAGESAIR